MLAVIAAPTNLAAPRALAPRHDLYRSIHKALRVFMGDTLARLGALDADDPVAAAPVLAQVRDLLAMLGHHLAIEDRFVLSAIERRRPGAAAGNAREHVAHAKELRELDDLVAAIEHAIATGSPERAHDAHRLFLALGDLVADNLVHMATEERHMNPILWALFSDEELAQIEGAIIASQTPAEARRGLRWIIPALTPAERAAALRGVRLRVPPVMFEQIGAFARTLLSPADIAKLDDALAR